ncbi:Rhodopsin domain-containing protein [Madurella fahalii]|uniref:Rhodopsin domain-containing protein n=1 Tax=Madurella fahalii TaxID=1157608 RepID=A0ABQ0GAE6_9PEZI
MADRGEILLPPDENRGPEILAICGSMVGLALVAVLLRIWVRAKMVRHVGADDWTIIAAMTVMFVEMMIIIPQVRLGAGRHVQYIEPKENITRGLHLNFVTQPLCLIALCLTKVSVGLFLLRLTPSLRFRYLVIGVTIFTILSATANILTVFFQCRPLALTWDSSVEGTCMPAANLKFAAYFNSSVAVLTDVLFALLPIPMLWKVQMNWKVKSAVAAILSLGVFAAVAAIVKITFLGNYGKHGDFLWDSADLTIWTTVEITVAIIAASFPCLKPLFKTLLAGSSARYGSKYKGYHDRNGDTNRTPKSGVRVAGSKPGAAQQFEMYNQNTVYTTDLKTGMRSTTGSEESILPQEIRNSRADGITKTSSVFVSYDKHERV